VAKIVRNSVEKAMEGQEAMEREWGQVILANQEYHPASLAVARVLQGQA
jgi:hypothetical protein